MTFQTGDRVRLKAKPEVVGCLQYFEDSEWCVSWTLEPNLSVWRFPEELEYAPEPIKKDDLVELPSGVRGLVRGVHDIWAWVDTYGVLDTRRIDTLKKVNDVRP